MLFSTLAYAQFFIATFVVYWLLVEKRFAGLLSGLLSLCLALSTCLPSGLLTGALSPNNSATPYWLRGILVFLAISQCSWQWKSYQAEARRAQGATLPSSQLALNIGLSTIIAGAIAYYDTSIVEALLAQLKILPESGFGGLQPPEVLPPGTTPPNHTESPASLSSGLIWLLRFSTLAIGGALLFLVLKTKRRSLEKEVNRSV